MKEGIQLSLFLRMDAPHTMTIDCVPSQDNPLFLKDLEATWRGKLVPHELCHPLLIFP